MIHSKGNNVKDKRIPLFKVGNPKPKPKPTNENHNDKNKLNGCDSIKSSVTQDYTPSTYRK